MKRFTVPVSYHLSGWIEIKASSRVEAIRKAKELNDVGFSSDLIEDREDTSEVLVDEIEEVGA